MKTYRKTAQAGVFQHGPDFFSEGQPEHALMLKEIQRGEAELKEFEPPPLGERRRAAFHTLGFTRDEFEEAFFEDRFEGKPAKLESLQRRRLAIKKGVR